MSLPELRERFPKRYPIRHYPDITHSRAVPVSGARLGRRVCGDRGARGDQSAAAGRGQIFRLLQPYTIGFLTYSEGCNDDVNKFVWSGLGWNPDAECTDILRDYGRYFIGERNRPTASRRGCWRWSATGAARSPPTRAWTPRSSSFRRWSAAAARRSRPTGASSRRFIAPTTMLLCASVCLTEIERSTVAAGVLGDARQAGALNAIARAERFLSSANLTARARTGGRERLNSPKRYSRAFGCSSVLPRYQAIAVGRGANLDAIDYALNNGLASGAVSRDPRDG